MTYQIDETRSYPHPPATVAQALTGAVNGLEGKIKKQDPAQGLYELWFDKKILGRVLGDRTQMAITIQAAHDNPNACAVTMAAIPVDAVGREMHFGIRKGVLKTVVGWFWAHLEHRLPAVATDS